MTTPIRVFAIGPSAIDLVGALSHVPVIDVSGQLGGTSSRPTSDCPLAPFVTGHSPTPAALAWGDDVRATRPDIVIADVACATCLGGETHKYWPGLVRTIAIGRPPLAECLTLLTTFGAALGIEATVAPEYQRRTARLLALRMHAARYLVRTPGAKRPTALALTPDGDAWRVHDDHRLGELIDAAGGVRAPIPIGAVASLGDIALAHPDVILAGRAGSGTAALTIARQVDSLGAMAPAVWHANWDTLLLSSGPSIVDTVEAILRATFPQALGANGTPPPGDVLRRVITQMAATS